MEKTKEQALRALKKKLIADGKITQGDELNPQRSQRETAGWSFDLGDIGKFFVGDDESFNELAIF